MFAIDFVLKSGKKIEGLIWRWNPTSGSMEVMDETNDKISKYNLTDVSEGLVYSDRIRKISKTEDIFEKAKADGWV